MTQVVEKVKESGITVSPVHVEEHVIGNEIESLIERLRSELPPVFTRSEIGILTGGVCHPGSIRNIESAEGKIPGGFYMRRRRCFERDKFLGWLATQISMVHQPVSAN